MIFKLVREDGLKYREVATILDISIKTVESQMGIAMKKINQAIQLNTEVGSRKSEVGQYRFYLTSDF
jgi:DNA-directed RNA polymerase specialized sigma24 family protein